MEKGARELEGTLLLLWAPLSPWRCRPSSPTGWSARPPPTWCQGTFTPVLITVSTCSAQGNRLVPRVPAISQPVLVWAFSPSSSSITASLLYVTSVTGDKEHRPQCFDPNTFHLFFLLILSSDFVAVSDNGTCSVSNVATAASKYFWKHEESWRWT